MPGCMAYGPAADLKTRRVIYPCTYFKCIIPCPCQICFRKLPKCRVGATQPCYCVDCQKTFENHNDFHGVFHFGCKFCFQLTRIFPVFNFIFLPKERDSEIHLRRWKSFSYKELKVEILPKEDPKEYFQKVIFKEDLGGVRCPVCNLRILSMPQIREHIELNHQASKLFLHQKRESWRKDNPTDFNCDQCGRSVHTSRKALVRHTELVHYEQSHKCTDCGKCFTRKDSLLSHKSEVQDPDIYECKNCDTKFSRIKSLDRHMKIAHENTMQYTCIQCGKNFNREDNLLRHRKVHEAGPNVEFTCEYCDKTFGVKAHFVRHTKCIINNDGSAKFVCNQCEKNFCTSKLLRAHFNSQHRQFKCERCLFVFCSKNALLLHIQYQQLLYCKECEKNFCNKNSINSHRIRVHDDSSIECEVEN